MNRVDIRPGGNLPDVTHIEKTVNKLHETVETNTDLCEETDEAVITGFF